MSLPAGQSPQVYTIGHSTRSFDEFLEILQSFQIQAIADVRLIPKSRRYPHFADSYLESHLPEHGIAYLSFKSLGGRRRPAKNSINTAWRNESFRGYADFMQTPAFAAALEDLRTAARRQPTAFMCAEAVPWRCHRSLIADSLLARGWEVLDIMGRGKGSAHKMTPFARIEGGRLIYPGEAAV
jgi:uncharacterized protein (DUF488 family)